MLAERGDGLLIVADQICGDMASVIGGKEREPGTLHGYHLAVYLYLRRTAWRENQVADFLRGAQHGAEQGRRGDRATSREAFQRNRNWSNGWCCHSSSHLGNRTHHRIREKLDFRKKLRYFNVPRREPTAKDSKVHRLW